MTLQLTCLHGRGALRIATVRGFSLHYRSAMVHSAVLEVIERVGVVHILIPPATLYCVFHKH